jgi:hypothetical protein
VSCGSGDAGAPLMSSSCEGSDPNLGADLMSQHARGRRRAGKPRRHAYFERVAKLPRADTRPPSSRSKLSGQDVPCHTRTGADRTSALERVRAQQLPEKGLWSS